MEAAGVDPTAPRKGRRTKKGVFVGDITRQDLEANFHLPSARAAERLKVGLTVLKRICRKFGIERWPYQGKGVAPGAAGGPPKPRQAAQQRGIGEAAVADGPTLSGDVPMHSAGGGAAAHELDGLQHFDEVRARTPSSSGSGSRGSPRSRHGGLPGEARPAGQALSPGLELDHPAAWDYGAGGAGFADLHLNTLPNLQHLKLASGDSPSTHSAGSCSSGTSTSGAAPLGSPERRRAAARPPLPPPAQHHQQPHAAGAPPVAAHLPAQQAHQPRLPPIVVGLPGGPEPAADSQACSAAFLDSNLFLQGIRDAATHMQSAGSGGWSAVRDVQPPPQLQPQHALSLPSSPTSFPRPGQHAQQAQQQRPPGMGPSPFLQPPTPPSCQPATPCGQTPWDGPELWRRGSAPGQLYAGYNTQPPEPPSKQQQQPRQQGPQLAALPASPFVQPAPAPANPAATATACDPNSMWRLGSAPGWLDGQCLQPRGPGPSAQPAALAASPFLQPAAPRSGRPPLPASQAARDPQEEMWRLGSAPGWLGSGGGAELQPQARRQPPQLQPSPLGQPPPAQQAQQQLPPAQQAQQQLPPAQQAQQLPAFLASPFLQPAAPPPNHPSLPGPQTAPEPQDMWRLGSAPGWLGNGGGRQALQQLQQQQFQYRQQQSQQQRLDQLGFPPQQPCTAGGPFSLPPASQQPPVPPSPTPWDAPEMPRYGSAPGWISAAAEGLTLRPSGPAALAPLERTPTPTLGAPLAPQQQQQQHQQAWAQQQQRQPQPQPAGANVPPGQQPPPSPFFQTVPPSPTQLAAPSPTQLLHSPASGGWDPPEIWRRGSAPGWLDGAGLGSQLGGRAAFAQPHQRLEGASLLAPQQAQQPPPFQAVELRPDQLRAVAPSPFLQPAAPAAQPQPGPQGGAAAAGAAAWEVPELWRRCSAPAWLDGSEGGGAGLGLAPGGRVSPPGQLRPPEEHHLQVVLEEEEGLGAELAELLCEWAGDELSVPLPCSVELPPLSPDSRPPGAASAVPAAAP